MQIKNGIQVSGFSNDVTDGFLCDVGSMRDYFGGMLDEFDMFFKPKCSGITCIQKWEAQREIDLG